MQGSGLRVRVTWGVGFGGSGRSRVEADLVQGLGFGVPSYLVVVAAAESEIPVPFYSGVLGYRVWGLGLGVGGLGFRV